jgi:hypothetical protein
MTLRRPPELTQCFVCRNASHLYSYPQLCEGHSADMARALREVEDLADALNDEFTTLMRPAYDDRLTAVIRAATDCDLPGLHYVKTKRIVEFMRRLDATVAKDDDFARIVTAWWNARQATVDAEKLALQIAWAPVGVEVRRAADA